MAQYFGPKGRMFEGGETTPSDLFKEWDVKGAIAATMDGTQVDLFSTLTSGGTILPIFPDTTEGLEILRHSASHLMAQAILRLYPGAKFGVGPAIKDGFYYDVLFPTPLSDEDLPKIEAEMRKIAKEKLRVERLDMTAAEALERFHDDPFKVELINDIGAEHVSLYGQGE